MSYIFNLRKSQALIPELGQGLQKYNQEDDESIDPTNTLAIFEAEIWPEIKEYFGANKDVLDVGCGNGRFSAYLSDHAQRYSHGQQAPPRWILQSRGIM